MKRSREKGNALLELVLIVFIVLAVCLGAALYL